MFDTLPSLRGRRIVLASKSPRRIELLRNLGLDFNVVGSTFPEDLDKAQFAAPEEYVLENARRKALEVYESLCAQESTAPDVVIGADTVVVHGSRILEKPESSSAAETMLRGLRDAETHRVVTGLCLVTSQGIHCFTESTRVTMHATDADIARYVATGEPLDKAGGYGYQGHAACLISKIDGCYYNVVGLPIRRLYMELDRLGQQQ